MPPGLTQPRRFLIRIRLELQLIGGEAQAYQSDENGRQGAQVFYPGRNPILILLEEKPYLENSNASADGVETITPVPDDCTSPLIA